MLKTLFMPVIANPPDFKKLAKKTVLEKLQTLEQNWQISKQHF